MRAVSLFSGAGGFEIGFERAGIRTVLQAESDPWCLEVLKRHWPEVERLDDVRSVGNRRESAWRDVADGVRPSVECRRREAGAGLLSDSVYEWAGRPERVGGRDELCIGQRVSTVDLVYGGFPCQDVSVAGKRAGLRGDRSGLFYEFARVVRELQPRWFAIENVPGLLSSADGRDFGTILGTMVELGYGVVWRVLDGRWFGVPQRRRRVLVVGCAGDAHRAAQVLAVCESCGGHPAPRGATGPRTAFSLTARAASGSRLGPAWSTNYVAATLSAGAHSNGVNLPGRHHEDDFNLVAAEAVYSLSSRQARLDREQSYVLSGALAAGGHGQSSPRGGDVSDNLIAFDWQTQGSERTRPHANGDYAGPLEAHKRDALAGAFGVRLLTPLECERLMGWPDEWTRWTSDGREIVDSHRYRMCGNGVIAPLAQWLGWRLMKVNRFIEEASV